MPSISKVKSCNMALSHIGTKSTIESLDEASAEAKTCKLWYDWARVQVLEDHNWNFARKRKALAVHGDAAPEGDWLYRYEYPSDCVKARYIVNPAGWTADASPFTVESTDDGAEKSILTDVSDAVLVYTWDLLNPGMFSSKFVDALSWRLAYHIAFPLTGDRQIQAQALQVYATVIRSAAGSNAGEGRERGPREAAAIRARE